jgi:hypothetical protein
MVTCCEPTASVTGGFFVPDDTTFRVTGDGHCGQPLGSQPFSHQPLEPGCQLPMAEMPTPEFPMPVPVTRHHESWQFFCSTKPLSLRASSVCPCPLVTVPACPLAAPPRSCQPAHWSTDQLVYGAAPPLCLPCPRVNLPASGGLANRPTDQPVNSCVSFTFALLHLCTCICPNASRPLDPSSHPTGDRGRACAHLGCSGCR